jgi:hypothetical protein
MTTPQDVAGVLADGSRYRATSYLLEVIAPDGTVQITVDAQGISGVSRAGNVVTIARHGDRSIILTGATLDDAGRLEAALRPVAPSPVMMAQPQKSGGGILKFGLIGCGGLIGLVVLVIVVAAVAVSSGDDSDESSASSSSSDVKSGADVHVPLAPGSTGTVKTAGDVTIGVTLNEVVDPATSSNQFIKPAAGSRYVAYDITVENVGKREGNAGQAKLRTVDGFEYDRAIAVGFGADNADVYQRLTSGGKVKGVIVFEIPEAAQVQWLRFDPNPFAKGDLYFDAKPTQ